MSHAVYVTCVEIGKPVTAINRRLCTKEMNLPIVPRTGDRLVIDLAGGDDISAPVDSVIVSEDGVGIEIFVHDIDRLLDSGWELE